MPSKIVAAATALLPGALLGVALSLVISSVLVEISLNRFFAFYFGFFFLLMGGLILGRVLGAGRNGNRGSRPANAPALVVFASLVLLSGLLCFTFHRNWFLQPSPWKAALYGLLGLSVSFAVAFSGMDAMNFCYPVVETPRQVFVLLLASSVLGIIVGGLFGALHVGDKVRTLAMLRVDLAREQKASMPIGALIGAVAAVAIALAPNDTAEGMAGRVRYDPLAVHDDDDI